MISRRQLILGSVVTPVLAAACAPPGDPTVPSSTDPTTTAPRPLVRDPEHLLRRTTMGPTAGLREELDRLGADAWLEGQLDPSSLDDSECQALLDRLATPTLDPAELHRLHDDDRALILGELVMARWIRALHSRRQLHEVMVGLWTDHFNVDVGSGRVIFLKGAEEHQVMRAHALGRFADLLAADVSSPAMLVYLNNASSRADGANIPNENHARELLELHTVGVDGGYDEGDVLEVARLLSGWSVDRETGSMIFRDAWHYDGAIGEILDWKAGSTTGRAAGDSFIDHLARHPGTARHVSARICRRFVSDSPSDALVTGAAEVYLDHDTELAPVVRHVLGSDEFAAAAGAKTTTPFEYAAATARRLGAVVTGVDDRPATARLVGALGAMGSAPYRWPSPDGPPDVGTAWINPGLMLARWNAVLALVADGAPGIQVDWDALDPDESTDVGTHLDRLATGLGVPLDEPTRDACLELWGLDPAAPAPRPSRPLLKELCAVMLVSPPAHQR